MTNIVLENALYAAALSDGATKRAPATRASDVLNIRDFGCIGDGVHDDAPGLELAIQAAFGTSSPLGSGASLYAPAGSYLLNSHIDFGALGGGGRGRFFGAGKGATVFAGTINDNFLFTCKNGDEAFAEISEMTIANFSSVPGTGAVRWIPGFSCSSLINIDFTGMICLDMTFNSFNVNVFGCNFSPTITLAPGTLGLVTNSVALIGARWEHFEIGLMAGGNGANGLVLYNTSAEENGIGYLLGMMMGWASACTVAPEAGNSGFSILTVGGEISPANTGGAAWPSFLRNFPVFGGTLPSTFAEPQGGVFIVGDRDPTNPLTISSYTYNSGTGIVVLTVDVTPTLKVGGAIAVSGLNIAGLNGTFTVSAISLSTVTYTGPTGQAGSPLSGGSFLDNSLTGAGYAGTYRLSGSYTISSPTPIMSRVFWQMQGADISGGETEGCYHGLYILNSGNVSIRNFAFTGHVGESAGPTGEKTITAHSHVYINNVNLSRMESVACDSGTSAGSIYFAPNAGTYGLTMENCTANSTFNSLTDAATTVGSGGNANIMTVNAMDPTNQGSIGYGMTITGTGIPGGTTIIGTALNDGTVTGLGAAGTYKLSANIGPLTGRQVTAVGGPAWTFPTGGNTRAGLQLGNCAAVINNVNAFINTPAITFTELPGQAGAKGAPFEGQTFDITDCNTATFLATAAAGGTGATAHRRVRYNAASAIWQVIG